MIFIILLLSFISCYKGDLPESGYCDLNPCDTPYLFDELDTLWTMPLANVNYVHDILFSDKNVFVSYVDDNFFAGVRSYNSNNGVLNWEWKSSNISSPSSFKVSAKNDILVLHDSRNIASINLNDGSTKSLFKDLQGIPTNPYGQLMGDYYYRSHGKDDESEAWILRSHVNDIMNWEKVYAVTKDQAGGSKPNPQSYNLWIDPDSKDEILIFQHRMAFPNRIDIEAWNITKQRSEWRYNDVAKLKNSNHQQIFILKDKAYFMAGTTLFCFAMKSGEIVWEFDHPSGINAFMFHQLAYCKDEHLLIHKDGSSLLAFDPDAGDLVYRNMSAGDADVSAGSPVCAEGMIYYIATLKLHAHKASTGRLIWDKESYIDQHSTFKGNIAIDKGNEIMYVSDRSNLLAIKFHE